MAEHETVKFNISIHIDTEGTVNTDLTVAEWNALTDERGHLMILPVETSAYRVGNHQPQNIYRGDQYIGVMFTAEDAAAVVQMLNMHECRACPPSCGSCSHDPDCECYEHQNNHPGFSGEAGDL